MLEEEVNGMEKGIQKSGLSVLRKATGLSAEEFADEIGVTRATIWNWQKNETPMAGPARRRLYEKFDLPYDLNIQAEPTEEEKEIIQQCGLDYRRERYLAEMPDVVRPYDRRVNSREIDRILAEVKRAYLTAGVSRDPVIRIMVDALTMKMNERR